MMVDLEFINNRIMALRDKASHAHEVDCVWLAFWSPVIGGILLKSIGYQDVSPWVYLSLVVSGAFTGFHSGKSRGKEIRAEAEALLAQKMQYEALVRIEARLDRMPWS